MPRKSLRAFCRLFTILAAITTASAGAGEVVGEQHDGRWESANFAQINLACVQAWKCIPGVDVLHGDDTKVATTPATTTTGVCNVGGGPADTCNSCAASPPTDRCQYWLEKK
jgi:hypothetical protein